MKKMRLKSTMKDGNTFIDLFTGRGGHSRASRIDPQGDGGTAGIRQGEVNDA